jgi:Tol biopolymer transport system component
VYGRPDGYAGFDLYVSQRASLTAPWGEPQNLGPNINTSSSEQNPALSLDEHILYFTSDRPGGVGGSDIYGSRRHNRKNDLAWQEPVNLGSGVNSYKNENGPALFEDDETGAIYLYFGSDRPGGLGGIDIYASTLQPDESFGPSEIVYELNTIYNDQRPSIRRDGLEIFFDSTRRPGGFGITDLWVTTRLSTSEHWSIPVNLGSLINTADVDVRPSLSFDGTALYFHSGGRGGYGGYDLFVSTRTRLKGNDEDEK